MEGRDMAERTEETEVNNIIFCYKIGNTFTAIWTKQKDQWSAVIPNHFKMCFTIHTPANFIDPQNILRSDQVGEIIRRRIREKADEQKASGKFYEMQITERKTKSRR